MQNMNMKPLDVFNFKTDVFYYVRYTIVQHSITIAVHNYYYAKGGYRA